MPPSSYASHGTPTARFHARVDRGRARGGRTEALTSRLPFMGWCPDLSPHIVGVNGYRTGRGVIGMPWRGGLGYYLRPDIGWSRVGSAQLPLGGSRACVGLAAIRLDNADYEGYAIHAGVVAATNITMSRFKADGTWATVAKDAAANNIRTDRDVLWNAVTFAFGAPTRSSAINEAVLVWAGQDEFGNPQEVLVTPDATGVGTYDELDRFSTLDPFLAGSVEVFESKVLFLNTNEAGTHYPFRLRYSPEGTADPDPAEPGTGYIEPTEFTQPGLRVLKIGNKVACYYGDGLIFYQPTGIPGDSFTPDYTNQSRGLLGKFCVVPVTEDAHFGIFTDGFWLVSSTGQWKRVGVVHGEGQSFDKFWHTFYNNLALDQRHRIVVTYDGARRLIRIAHPTLTQPENYSILNIDLNDSQDVAWTDTYAKPVTMWGNWNTQIRTATSWAALTAAGTTWADLMAAGTLWSDFAAAYGVQNLVQATDDGLIYQRDNTLFTQDGVTPPWSLEFHPLNVSKLVAQDQTLREVFALFRAISGPSFSVTISGNQGGHQQSQTLPFDEAAAIAYAQETLRATFNHRASSHYIQLAGTAPFLLGQWGVVIEADLGLDVRGQNV